LGAAFPEFFIDRWAETGDRFEPRYIAWIENEADDYEFLPSSAPKEGIWDKARGLLGV
jgi:hypothetical protein